MKRKISMRGLGAELRELERTNPEVKAAAENYDRVRNQILSREPDWKQEAADLLKSTHGEYCGYDHASTKCSRAGRPCWHHRRNALLNRKDGHVEVLARLRSRGWMVAVHNDYQLAGDLHTFWLLTHPDGRWMKGEGRTDAEAICNLKVGGEK